MALRAASRLLRPLSLQAQHNAGALACGFSSSTSPFSVTGNRGRTAGEAGHAAAESLGERGQRAGESSTAAKAEDKASSGGFVPAPDATPSPEAAGQVGGPGMGAMADVIDAVGGAFTGDGRRVERAVEDLTHDNAGVPRTSHPPHTTSQDWPRHGLQPEGPSATQDEDATAVNKFEGAEPGGTPTAPPSIDQNPPENTTAAPAAVAGATPEYDARGDPISNRGASRPM